MAGNGRAFCVKPRLQLISEMSIRIYSSALTESDTRQSHQTSIAENPMFYAAYSLRC